MKRFGARWLLGRAVGSLMERFEINEDRALYCLVRMAAAGQVGLGEVARVVVDEVNTRAQIG